MVSVGVFLRCQCEYPWENGPTEGDAERANGMGSWPPTSPAFSYRVHRKWQSKKYPVVMKYLN